MTLPEDRHRRTPISGKPGSRPIRPEHGHGHGHGHDHPGGIRGLALGLFKPHSHDSADSVDSELEGSAQGTRAVKISLFALGITAVAQLVVVLATSSVALLADTIHNFSDAFTAVPLWIAFALSRRAATRRYTYGFGRAEDLAGLFVVLMITLSAVLAAYESIRRLIDPQPLTYVWVVVAAGVLGFLGNEVVAVYRIRVGRTIGSAALVADGLHARTDGLTSLAVSAGALFVVAGFPIADPIVGLLITVAILAVLRGAVREVFRRLMDGVEPELIDEAERALGTVAGIREVKQLRMRWIGHRLIADVELDVDPGLTLSAAHDVAHTAEAELVHAVSKLDSATVHAYPAHPSSSSR
jgi:cation diffusion facilitator family transporter